MHEVEEVLRRIVALVEPHPTEVVAVAEACGRVLREVPMASVDVPGFDNSSVDGYAVRSADVRSGCEARLRVVGSVAAGGTWGGRLGEGECLRVYTGSPLPDGADAVVMQEDVRREAGEEAWIRVLEGVGPWENVRFRGEDLKRGMGLGASGERIRPTHLALFQAAGVSSVVVGRLPRVAVLATGSELQEVGGDLRPGHLYESNRAMLSALAASCGGSCQVFPLVPDDRRATLEALRQAFEVADVVLTSGGVSVGDYDYVRSCFEELGGELNLWRVAMRPGKPFAFGRRGGGWFFGLPGNPVSAFVTFLILVRPALLRLQGASATGLPASERVLGETLANPGERRHYVRVCLDGEGRVVSAGTQASHFLSSLARATGLVEVPPRTRLEAGCVVRVLSAGD